MNARNNLLSGVFEFVYESIERIPGRLSESVDGNTEGCLADVRRVMIVERVESIIFVSDVTNQKVATLQR